MRTDPVGSEKWFIKLFLKISHFLERKVCTHPLCCHPKGVDVFCMFTKNYGNLNKVRSLVNVSEYWFINDNKCTVMM